MLAIPTRRRSLLDDLPVRRSLRALHLADSDTLIERVGAQASDLGHKVRSAAPDALAGLSSYPVAVGRAALELAPMHRRSRRWPRLGLLVGLASVGVALFTLSRVVRSRMIDVTPVVPESLTAEKAFDRDAGIRAAGEGMEAPGLVALPPAAPSAKVQDFVTPVDVAATTPYGRSNGDARNDPA